MCVVGEMSVKTIAHFRQAPGLQIADFTLQIE
jgi:hypothetical protein